MTTYHCLNHPWFLNTKCLDRLKDINNALCLATLDAIQQGTKHSTSADGVTKKPGITNIVADLPIVYSILLSLYSQHYNEFNFKLFRAASNWTVIMKFSVCFFILQCMLQWVCSNKMLLLHWCYAGNIQETWELRGGGCSYWFWYMSQNAHKTSWGACTHSHLEGHKYFLLDCMSWL